MYMHHEIVVEVARYHRAELLAIAADSRRSAYARLIRRLRTRQQAAKRQSTSPAEAAPAPVPLDERQTTARVADAKTALRQPFRNDCIRRPTADPG
jgi:hypothetical protein